MSTVTESSFIEIVRPGNSPFYFSYVGGCLCDLSIFFKGFIYLKSRVNGWWWDGRGDQNISHSLVHSSSACSSKGWARQPGRIRPGLPWEPSPRCLGRKLNRKQRSWWDVGIPHGATALASQVTHHHHLKLFLTFGRVGADEREFLVSPVFVVLEPESSHASQPCCLAGSALASSWTRAS